MSAESKLRSATLSYQQSRADLANLISDREKLQVQMNENLSVKNEFDQISSSAPKVDFQIYKLIGNMLIKQDTEESKSNVNRRIEFLKNEESVF
ncbi:hypothetical protein BY996DRAFT_4585799 [Phakopsora pachyrhizi]|uniref:Uncharacterized protein n=1 Tax=Phakopsora pachyrhizi TaxID=170000 RepID=A0AAV0BW52_PHAPC|nr:hypothetical protein BY996DRAFT_4585799 [Phakopsora pachyrhizi]CAH7690482.1 hypothetical protein PPACK8108_LOCUS25837 [Phakopsora pachyrhizi]